MLDRLGFSKEEKFVVRMTGGVGDEDGWQRGAGRAPLVRGRGRLNGQQADGTPPWAHPCFIRRAALADPVRACMRAGCPNGCARPYMAELGLVGDGPNSYQVWLGGSHNATRLAETYAERVKAKVRVGRRGRGRGERQQGRADVWCCCQ